MQWQHLNDFTLTENWQYSIPVKAKTFRLSHIVNNPYTYRISALVTLISFSEDRNITEIFKPQKVTPYKESELIQFPDPPKEWQYSLGVKQLVYPGNSLINWVVRIDMPLYAIVSEPTLNPIQSTQFTTSTVPVNNNAPIKLVSANLSRKELTIFNPDTKNSIYLDLTNTVSVITASFIIPPGQVYIADIHWVGEVWAITKSGTVNVSIREFT